MGKALDTKKGVGVRGEEGIFGKLDEETLFYLLDIFYHAEQDTMQYEYMITLNIMKMK